MIFRALGKLIAGLTLMSELGAHDFWIEPDAFMPEPGTEVSVSLREGVEFKGNTLPYITEWFADFSRVTDAGREQVRSLLGSDPAASITVSEGSLLLGYQSAGNFVALEAEKFNAYLDEEGIAYLRDVRRARGEDDQPAPENFYRCAKALLQAGETKGELYKQHLGYTLELVPEADPYTLSAGDNLTFKVLLRGKPATGLLVQAFSRADPSQIEKVRVDVDGRATVALTSAGIWFVKAVSIEAIDPDKKDDYFFVTSGPGAGQARPGALWESFWASFLFEVPG